ncbi:microcystin degradation protein MlrC [Aurantimonas aggregata]|uniref:Microcystinase C n=1 Tax=Aurantimonas aggregata TaxID=2047720 RepID=A0A6L9MCC4_9HYPH|nr:M81 family metallopeptidase [Aurantimonas aggregata]NDV85453.1 microcystin degradation protein MlrC [Aurantimonas aggregata]
MTKPRIAVGGFMHETNTFGPSKAGIDAFIEGGGWPALSEGAALIEATRDVNMGICGFVEAAEAEGWDLVPTLWCAASPSAHVTEAAFEDIAGRIIAGIEAAGPLDGVYLDLHGAMVAEHVDDGEGELLARVRAVVGPNVPIVASLDLHANVTQTMVDAADALIAYRTYPHVDMAETGRRAAAYLGRRLDGQRDAKAFRQVPFLIPIAWQCTGMEPCRSLYASLPPFEADGIASISLLTGFPAADFADCGPSIVAYAPTQEAADRAADALLDAISRRETDFAGKVFAPDAGVAEAIALSANARRPVVIADTQDNPGAGGDSDTTGMLRALVTADAQRAAIGVIVDPQAAAEAHRAGVGATVSLGLGGKSGIAGDAPFEAAFIVESLSDGQLVAAGPFYGGARMQLGPSACLRIGEVRIVVGSRKAQMADQEMYRFVGIEPTEQAILVNKSSVHFRADFEPIAETILVCAAPGPMPVDPAALPFTRLRHGMRLSPGGPAFG